LRGPSLERIVIGIAARTASRRIVIVALLSGAVDCVSIAVFAASAVFSSSSMLTLRSLLLSHDQDTVSRGTPIAIALCRRGASLIFHKTLLSRLTPVPERCYVVYTKYLPLPI